MPKALIVWGGWAGHQPKEVAAIFERVLTEEGFSVEVSESLDSFLDKPAIMDLSLIVPIYTMSKISGDQAQNVFVAVREAGVGMAGCHGGMCDSFRENTEWQFMTGGQWVAHPGNDGIEYTVNITDPAHPITASPTPLRDFKVKSEQYYLHVDPAVKVLATTTFPTPGVDGPHHGNGEVKMPQVWTKMYGKGRIFYNALGHQANIFDIPEALEFMRRGFRWAAKKA